MCFFIVAKSRTWVHFYSRVRLNKQPRRPELFADDADFYTISSAWTMEEEKNN